MTGGRKHPNLSAVSFSVSKESSLRDRGKERVRDRRTERQMD